MYKLTIEGEGLNFTMDITDYLTKTVIMAVIDKRLAPKSQPVVVQATPAVEPIQISETESEPEDGEPP